MGGGGQWQHQEGKAPRGDITGGEGDRHSSRGTARAKPGVRTGFCLGVGEGDKTKSVYHHFL